MSFSIELLFPITWIPYRRFYLVILKECYYPIYDYRYLLIIVYHITCPPVTLLYVSIFSHIFPGNSLKKLITFSIISGTLVLTSSTVSTTHLYPTTTTRAYYLIWKLFKPLYYISYYLWYSFCNKGLYPFYCCAYFFSYYPPNF